MSVQLRKELRDITRTRMGHAWRHQSDALMLDRNERAEPFEPEVMAALAERLSKLRLNLYPELDPFYTELAAFLGCGADQLFITEGVSGAIKSLLEALAPAGSNAVIPQPTFALYPVYCRMFGVEVRNVGYTEDYRLDLDALEAAIDDDTSFVFLPNPNIPIEGYLPLERIAALAERCARHNAILLADEVYYPFGGETAQGLIAGHPNLVVVRSFSKAFGLAGVRVGYVIGQPDLVEHVAKVRTGYETNTLSMEVVRFFLENFHLVQAHVARVKDGLAYLRQRVTAAGLIANGGVTGNYLYIDLGDPALVTEVAKRLKDLDIHIRSGWPAPFNRGLSVSGAGRPLMERVADALLAALDEVRAGK